MKLEHLTDNIRRGMNQADRKALGKHGMTAEEAMADFVAKSEKDLQKKMAQLLDQRGIAYNVHRMDKKSTGTPGWPDFTFAIMGAEGRGWPIAIEVKYDEGEQSENQIRCIAKMKKDGWIVHEVRTLQEFHALLNHLQWTAGHKP